MIEVLENNKKVIVEENKITVSSTINNISFLQCKDKSQHAVLFTEEPVTFTGVATLKDGDKSNELEATRIAESKMERQYYKYVKTEQKMMISEFTKYLAFFEKELTKTNNNIKKADIHIEEICERI